jgi:hypothetical protein
MCLYLVLLQKKQKRLGYIAIQTGASHFEAPRSLSIKKIILKSEFARQTPSNTPYTTPILSEQISRQCARRKHDGLSPHVLRVSRQRPMRRKSGALAETKIHISRLSGMLLGGFVGVDASELTGEQALGPVTGRR